MCNKSKFESLEKQIDGLSKQLDTYHAEDREDKNLMWANMKELNTFKSRWIGIVTGMTLVFSGIWALIGLAWKQIVHSG